MRIAQLAPLVELVPPIGYGGTELVVHLVTEELVKRGHEVTLFAAGGSATAARLVTVSDHELRNHEHVDRWQAFDIRSLLRLKDMQSEFDIVHNHMGYQALPYLDRLNCAVVSTNHNHVKTYCRDIYFAFSQLPYVSISDSYRKFNYQDRLNYVATVYNGIDVDRHFYDPNAERNYLLFIGRLCADKGTADAIKVAQALGLPLKIAGKVDRNDRDYFEQQVKPFLNDDKITYLGEVNFEEKARLYSKAIALVYPIDFEEPFGLVMAESLAAGTPVMAFDRGSVREVLSDGETAVIGHTVEELVARFAEIGKISPAVCRQRAASMFSKQKMTQHYEEVYRALLGLSGPAGVEELVNTPG